MLTVHHLGRSQSERIVWLCEELGLDYELKRYERDPVTRLEPPPEHRILVDLQARLGRALDFMNRRLGEADYLAGNELTAADIMMVFSLTTMRMFTAYDLKPYLHILAYLRRIGAREGYQRAMRKGDPGMTPVLD